MSGTGNSPEKLGSVIAGSFNDFVLRDVVSTGAESISSKNFEKLRKNLRPGDPQRDLLIRENEEELETLNACWEYFASDPADNEQSANVLFSTLALISGTHRYISALQACDVKIITVCSPGLLP